MFLCGKIPKNKTTDKLTMTITPGQALDKLYSTIWSRDTLRQRAINHHNGDEEIKSWVNENDGSLDIFGIKPKENIEIGHIVLFYIKKNPSVWGVVGAGRIGYHRYNNFRVYNDVKFNEYAIYLDRVMFFDTPITTNTPNARLDTHRFSHSLRGDKIITKVSVRNGDNKQLWLNLLSDLLQIPSFYRLFTSDVDEIDYINSIQPITNNIVRVDRERGQEIVPVSGEFSEWKIFRNSNTSRSDMRQINDDINASAGVYELGLVNEQDIVDNSTGTIINADLVSPVYVGKSYNLYNRLKDHIFPQGANRQRIYNEALENGKVIVRRYVYLDNKYMAEYIESDLLSRYNYTWNIQNNT